MKNQHTMQTNTEAKPVQMTNEEIRESGAMGGMIQAMDHEVDTAAAYDALEKGAVDAYQKIENAVVGAYKKVENGVVDAYRKMEDHFVEKLFARDGESVEEAKERLKK